MDGRSLITPQFLLAAPQGFPSLCKRSESHLREEGTVAAALGNEGPTLFVPNHKDGTAPVFVSFLGCDKPPELRQAPWAVTADPQPVLRRGRKGQCGAGQAGVCLGPRGVLQGGFRAGPRVP